MLPHRRVKGESPQSGTYYITNCFHHSNTPTEVSLWDTVQTFNKVTFFCFISLSSININIYEYEGLSPDQNYTPCVIHHVDQSLSDSNVSP